MTYQRNFGFLDLEVSGIVIISNWHVLGQGCSDRRGGGGGGASVSPYPHHYIVILLTLIHLYQTGKLEIIKTVDGKLVICTKALSGNTESIHIDLIYKHMMNQLIIINLADDKQENRFNDGKCDAVSMTITSVDYTMGAGSFYILERCSNFLLKF